MCFRWGGGIGGIAPDGDLSELSLDRLGLEIMSHGDGVIMESVGVGIGNVDGGGLRNSFCWSIFPGGGENFNFLGGGGGCGCGGGGGPIRHRRDNTRAQGGTPRGIGGPMR